jgi:hypothetical protein
MAADTTSVRDLEKNEKVSVYSKGSGSELDVEVQIARESNNEIKYRTCSWQKVNLSIFSMIFGD